MYFFVRGLLVTNVKSSLVELSRQGAKRVEGELNAHLNVLETLSTFEEIKNPDYPWYVKLRVIENFSSQRFLRLRRISLVDAKGYSKTSDGQSLFVGDRPYFLKALAGKRNISDPVVSRVDGTMVIIFAVPVYHEGQITGALYATQPVEALSEITDNIRLGEKGNSFIIDGNGRTLAHQDRTLVYTTTNDIINNRKNPELTALSDLKAQMTAGKTGAGEYSYQGVVKYLGFSPIANIGWSFAISAPKSEVFGNFDLILLFFVILLVLMFLLFFIFYWQAFTLQNSLVVNQTFFNNAVETAHMVIIGCDVEGKILSFNEFAEKKLNIAKENAIGHLFLHDMVPENKRPRIARTVQLLKTKSFVRIEFPVLRQDGDKLYFLWSIISTRRFSGDLERLTLMGIDITDRVKSEHLLRDNNKKLTQLYRELSASEETLRQRLEELTDTQGKLLKSEERYQLAQEGSNDILWDLDIEVNQLYLSPKFNELFGYPKNVKINTPEKLLELVHPEETDSVKNDLANCLTGQTSLFQHDLRLRGRDDDYRWFSMRGKVAKDRSGKLRMAGSLTDITEQKFQDQLIQQLAYTDHLTRLPNRASLNQHLSAIVFRATSSGKSGALLYLDLDNFKLINDAYGHSFGDLVIKKVSNLLLTALPGVNVYRFGGDEFVLLAPEIDGSPGLQRLAEQVMSVFNAPFVIKDRTLHISFSMGITCFPEDGESLEELLKNADTALHRAKEAGKNRWFLFDRAMKDVASEKMEMENSLRTALKNNEFFLVYQPQFNPLNGEVVGFEALIRWKSPEYGCVPPERFITLAEANGLIIPIGLWVLEQAARFAARLNQEGITGLIVSVNLSARQLMQSDFVQKAVQATINNGVRPEQIGLELTETAVMESYETNLETLRLLKNEGFRLFLDDFGTGYSSLSYLRAFPLDALKIDKSFVADISDINHQPLVRSIIDLAHQINLDVVGEGVETVEQLRYLTNCNCDQVQGFLLGRPVPEDEALQIGKRRKVDID